MDRSFVFALLMVAAFALTLGSLRLWRAGDRTKGGLMLVCAIVMIANVVIWTA